MAPMKDCVVCDRKCMKSSGERERMDRTLCVVDTIQKDKVPLQRRDR